MDSAESVTLRKRSSDNLRPLQTPNIQFKKDANTVFTMSSNLSGHINIGKDTETKLIQIEIDSFEKLVSMGTEQTFIQLQTITRVLV